MAGGRCADADADADALAQTGNAEADPSQDGEQTAVNER
jgi:hypothetical protein